MRTPELETVNIFSKDLNLNLTINQISKQLDMAYASTNKYIRIFLEQGLLNKKIVGSAILCSLNFSNEKTLGLLMLNSIHEKIEYLKKSDKKKSALIAKLREIPYLNSLFLSNNQIHLICEDKEKAAEFISKKDNAWAQKEHKIVLMDQNEFKLKFRNIDLKNTIIFDGYEKFWRMISEMMT